MERPLGINNHVAQILVFEGREWEWEWKVYLLVVAGWALSDVHQSYVSRKAANAAHRSDTQHGASCCCCCCWLERRAGKLVLSCLSHLTVWKAACERAKEVNKRKWKWNWSKPASSSTSPLARKKIHKQIDEFGTNGDARPEKYSWWARFAGKASASWAGNSKKERQLVWNISASMRVALIMPQFYSKFNQKPYQSLNFPLFYQPLAESQTSSGSSKSGKCVRSRISWSRISQWKYSCGSQACNDVTTDCQLTWGITDIRKQTHKLASTSESLSFGSPGGGGKEKVEILRKRARGQEFDLCKALSCSLFLSLSLVPCVYYCIRN